MFPQSGWASESLGIQSLQGAAWESIYFKAPPHDSDVQPELTSWFSRASQTLLYMQAFAFLTSSQVVLILLVRRPNKAVRSWFSACGPWTSHMRIIWELIRKQIVSSHSGSTESKTLGWGPAIWVPTILMGAFDPHQSLRTATVNNTSSKVQWCGAVDLKNLSSNLSSVPTLPGT